MKQLHHTLALILFFVAASALQANAQALYEVSLDEKLQASTIIAEGKVTEQTCFWNSTHSVIFTASKVEVYKVFKGNAVPAFIEILTQGGTIGDESIGVTDQLQLEKGETGVFFCYPNTINARSPLTGNKLLEVYSSGQGFFKYDKRTGGASAPYVRYAGITDELYPQLVQKIGHNYINKKPSFSVTAVQQLFTANTAAAITSFTPTTVNAGKLSDPATNLLTINGTGFGTPTGLAAVSFDDANNGTGGTTYDVAATSSLVVSWSATQIQIRVPSRAGTGSFTVTDDLGNVSAASATLTVDYSILNLTFGAAPTERSLNLMNTNGTGGYNYLYSTSTAGSGTDFSTSTVEPSFNRAITTWKEVCGLNYSYNGTTASQNISVSAANLENIIMLDNTNTGVSPLPSGVLASCYYNGSSCAGNLYARSVGFDILIRKTGVSTGATNFNLGPCKTSTAIAEYDMETVLLHELGHSLGLGHINDSYIGAWPNVDPGKVMNYAIVNGVDRRSPDWSCYTGALFCINPRLLVYGGCTASTEMIPLVATTESKDECPVVFPATATLNNTSVTFDLNHATSNKNKDPQYTAVNCSGTGTGITNNAYYAFKTGAAGTLTLTVSGYATTPASQAACGGAGVELTLFQTSSCPTGQAFPAPVATACRTFNADGILANITGLAANTTYLMMVDGISSTKANFSLVFNGGVLPLRVTDFSGAVKPDHNLLSWKLDNIISIDRVALEGSTDGIDFTELYTRAIASGTTSLAESFADSKPAAIKYYRLRFHDNNGSLSYSNIITLKRSGYDALVISPNPARDFVNISFLHASAGSVTFRLYDATGRLVRSKTANYPQGAQTIQLNFIKGLTAGNYYLQTQMGEKVLRDKVIVN